MPSVTWMPRLAAVVADQSFTLHQLRCKTLNNVTLSMSLLALMSVKDVQPRVRAQGSTAPTVRAAVAAGLGATLVHPLFADGIKERLAFRRFNPTIPFGFQLCRNRGSRNAQLVNDLIRDAKRVAEETSHEL